MQHNCHVCSILIQDPEITDITPTQGPKSGGTRVTIFGKYLNAGTVRRACFGNETFECKLIEERYWQKTKTKQNSIFMLPKADQSQKFFIYCGYISFYEHHFWCICMYSENNSFKGSWICCQWHYLYNMLLDITIQCSRNFVVKLNKEIHENRYSTNNYKTRVVSVFLYTLIVTLDSMQFNICVGSWKIVLYTLTM